MDKHPGKLIFKIDGCEDCPFCVTEYNGDADGYDTLAICQLNVYLSTKEIMPLNTVIAAYDSFAKRKKLKTPKWCPMEKYKTITITHDWNKGTTCRADL